MWRSLVNTQSIRKVVNGIIFGDITNNGSDSVVTIFQAHARHFRP